MTQIEKYNRFGVLIETYPDVTMASQHNGISSADLMRRTTYWNDSSHEQYKWARIEDCTVNETFPIVQRDVNGVLVNRFTTLEEAASVLGYSPTQIARWIKSGEADA